MALEYANERDQDFDRLEGFLKRFPDKETPIPSLVWPWMTATITQQSITAALVRRLGDRPIESITPYLAIMGAWAKVKVAERLIPQAAWTDDTRELILGLIRDRDSYVRERTLALLETEQYCPTPSKPKN